VEQLWNSALFRVEQFRPDRMPKTMQADLLEAACFVVSAIACNFVVLCIAENLAYATAYAAKLAILHDARKREPF
jgi:hypothetical protein